jgi:hypothetical protein
MRWQYQILSEPVGTPVTPDKWLPSTPDRFLKTVNRAAILAGALFFLNLGQAESTPIDKWKPTYPDKVYPQRRITQAGSTFTEVESSATLDKWIPETPDFRFKEKLRPATGGLLTEIDQPITPEKWLPSVPAFRFREKPRPFTGETRIEIDEVITPDKWTGSQSFQFKFPQRLFSGECRVELDIPPPTEIITLDKWTPLYRDSRSRVKINPFTGEMRFEIPEVITLDKWTPGLPSILRVKTGSRLLPDAYLLFDFQAAIPFDGVFPGTPPPFRMKVSLNPSLTQFHNGLVIVPVPLAEAFSPGSISRRLISQPTFGSGLVWVEPTGLDKWIGSEEIPTRPLRRNPIFVHPFLFNPELIEKVTMDKWFMATQEPLRVPIGKLRPSQFRLPVCFYLDNIIPPGAFSVYHRFVAFISQGKTLSGEVCLMNRVTGSIVATVEFDGQIGMEKAIDDLIVSIKKIEGNI